MLMTPVESFRSWGVSRTNRSSGSAMCGDLNKRTRSDFRYNASHTPHRNWIRAHDEIIVRMRVKPVQTTTFLPTMRSGRWQALIGVFKANVRVLLAYIQRTEPILATNHFYCASWGDTGAELDGTLKKCRWNQFGILNFGAWRLQPAGNHRHDFPK